MTIERNGITYELTGPELAAAYAEFKDTQYRIDVCRFMDAWYQDNGIEQGKYDDLIDDICDEYKSRMADSDDWKITLCDAAEMFLPDDLNKGKEA